MNKIINCVCKCPRMLEKKNPPEYELKAFFKYPA